MITLNLQFFGGGSGGRFPGTGGDNDKFVNNLDELLSNPSLLGRATPTEWHDFLIRTNFNPRPLNRGSKRDVHFENGGGFRVTWSGDRLLQFHPGGGHHGSVPYWKISTGTTGTARFDIFGNVKID